MSDSIRNQLSTFYGVEPSCGVEKVVHIAAPKLRHALLLRHLIVEFVDLAIYIPNSVATTGHDSRRTDYCTYKSHKINSFLNFLLHCNHKTGLINKYTEIPLSFQALSNDF